MEFRLKVQQTLHTPFPSHSIEAYYPGAGLGRWGGARREEGGGYGVRCFPPFTTLLFKHTANQKLARSTPARPHSTKMKILNKIRSNSVSQYPRASSLHDSLYSNQLRTFMERRTNKHAFERRLVGISLRKPSDDQAFCHIVSTSICGIHIPSSIHARCLFFK